MALELCLNESECHAVRRVGRKRARKALKAFADCESMDAVHAARKQIKQLRALLRLARAGVASRENQKLMRCLKHAASALAAPRDAFVKTTALKCLKEHFRDELAGEHFPLIESRLNKEKAVQQRYAAKRVAKVRRRFKQICRRFDRLEIKGTGWGLIGCGLKRTYRDGRRAYRAARQTERPEDLHEWRKRVKDLYYHIEFLCGIWPEQMQAMHKELDRLGECLGTGHDLHLLTRRDVLRELPTEAKPEANTVVKLADRRRAELVMRAFALGERLYSEKPAIFCKRLERYWKRWRARQGMEAGRL